MEYFVSQSSIVRKIWGKADTVLFIFAGSAAEFALNKAVDWLYFTGRLPNNPLDRLFSTVAYARLIIFSEMEAANTAIDQIKAIHTAVETKRNAQIPAWAYRDVLFMLIDCSIRSYEVLERKLTELEKAEVFEVFVRVGSRMGIAGLPCTYNQWVIMRKEHLQQDLLNSDFTAHLYAQYKKHLGFLRYQLLRQVQVLIVPPNVRGLLSLGNTPFLSPVLWLYKLSSLVKLDSYLRDLILPSAYKVQVKSLNQESFNN